MSEGVEIERKFLARHRPEELDTVDGEPIRQGYLATSPDGVEVRIRTRGPKAFLTVKKGAGMRRLEEEIEIDHERFGRLWPLTEGRQLDKTRYPIPLGDLVAEVDVYAGALDGLITVEVEFADEEVATAFQAPAWFGPDVTDDSRYRNQELAQHGAPTA